MILCCICLEYCVIFQNWSIHVENITSKIYVNVIVQSVYKVYIIYDCLINSMLLKLS